MKYNKTLACLMAFLVLGTSAAHAGVSYKLDDFTEKGLNDTVGVARKDGNTYAKNTLSPNLNFGGFGVGFDINAYLPLTNGNADLTVALRQVSYDYNNQWGFKWGRLTNITLGYGLLIDQYDSGAGQNSTEFTTDKAGVLAYGTLYQFRTDVMWTASNITAIRESYTWEESPILGSPVVIGGTYINDSDGVSRVLNKKPQDAWSADIALPIAGDFLTVYSEYSQLSQSGNFASNANGFSTGVKGDFGIAQYRLEYRNLGAGFVSSYFNDTYEATDGSSTVSNKSRSGFLASAGMSLFDGYSKASMMYERYEDLDLFSAAFGWKKVANTVGIVNYSRPLGASSAAVLDANIMYTTGTWYDYVIDYKRIYRTNNTSDDSYSVGFRMNLSKVFPGLSL